MVLDESRVDSFTEFVKKTEPHLLRALCIALGGDVGREATADALVHGWEHRDRVRVMDNAAGYLYRVSRNQVKHRRRKRPGLPPLPTEELPWIEPAS